MTSVVAAPRFISFFDGVGMFALGLQRAGWQCVGACEIEPFCRKVRTARMADGSLQQIDWYPNDITTVREEDIPDAELWIGGFPCQDLSQAGKGEGIHASRSGLVWTLLDLAEAKGIPWVLLENVPKLLTGRDEDGDDGVGGGAPGRGMADPAADPSWFGVLLRRMAQIWPAVGWRSANARHWGVAQRRERVFIVGGPGGGAVARALFPDAESGSRHSQARRTTRARPAGSPGSRSAPTRRALALGRSDPDGSGRSVGTDGAGDVAAPLTSSDGHHGRRSPRGDGSDNLIVSAIQGGGNRGYRIDAEGAAGGQLITQTTRRSFGLPGNGPAGRHGRETDTARCLDTTGLSPTANQGGTVVVQPYNIVGMAQQGRNHAVPTDVSGALQHKGLKPTGNEGGTLIHVPEIVGQAISAKWAKGSSGPAGDDTDTRLWCSSPAGPEEDAGFIVVPTILEALATGRAPQVLVASGIRRLTPRECELLMALPPGWTCLCPARGDTLRCVCPDGPRYRAIGNGGVVNVIEWLGRNLIAAMRAHGLEAA